ncbi:unnamed protein product [Orchesella dallaii]|uniref:Ammonium transporter n=1 Tax=Orchesella dallaii TaxID=48710 RepID=A0ABP1QLM8_9HEXA
MSNQTDSREEALTSNSTGQDGGSTNVQEILSWDDATWILTSAFIIFTMQTGFGLLESGCVSLKNEVNIMMKNVIDIVFGGITYWLFGYGLTYGELYTNPFFAIGYFAVDADIDEMGPVFSKFLFQLSFATTATTIVSGAMAERCNFRAYCLFSLCNTIVYCVPAGWIWGSHGFLHKLGAIDIGGSGAVHLVGGSSAFVAAWMLGPRLGRYDHGREPLPMGSPTNALLGLFMLWWGWLAFSSGSVFGVSGHKWKFSARAAVTTINASFGGGVVGLIYSYIRKKGKFDILDLISAVLGSLVSVTGGCAIYRPWEAIVIGAIGGGLACFGIPFFDWLHIDDPVGATSVHGLSAFWGVLAIGLFADGETLLNLTNGRSGLFKGGDAYLLGVQALAAVSFSLWAGFITFLLLWIINKFIPIRMEAHEELLGADLVEHGIRRSGVGVSRALSALGSHPNFDIEAGSAIGTNPVHLKILK